MRGKILEGNTLRDIAVLLFLLAVVGVALMVSLSGTAALAVYLPMMGVAFVAAVFAFFGRTSFALVVAGTQVSAFAALKLFGLYTAGTPFLLADYLWLPAPLLLTGAVCLFQYGSSLLERENVLLRAQVEDLVMIDALTGSYNLRALYRDMPGLAKQCARHGQPLSMLMVQLRFEQELRAFLNKRRFDEVKQRLADIARDVLRVEDKLYAVGEDGTLAILLLTGDEGCEIIKGRLRAAIERADAFDGIVEDELRVAVRLASKVCGGDDGARPIEFKLSVEGELSYDV